MENLKVLCVDDDRSCRTSIKILLEDRLTPDIDLAEDYESALKKIKEKRYDLIILDSLEGDCFRVYEDTRGIVQGDVVILSANMKIEKQAKSKKIPYYSKLANGLNKIIEKYGE